jgi:hypothetical protein
MKNSMSKQKAPESIDEIKHRIFRYGWALLDKQPRYLKMVWTLFAIVLFIIAARMSFLGEPLHYLSTYIIPSPPVLLSLSLDYTIQGTDGESRSGKRNDICHSGDIIFLTIKPEIDCWLMLFCIDSKGIHQIPNIPLEFQRVKAAMPINTSFYLDTTIGNEVYYALAARKYFNFIKTIQPFLFKSNASIKGPDPGPYSLNLPRGIVCDYINFRHEK